MTTDIILNKKACLLILVMLIITLIYQFLFLPWTNDDAFISFRYAENLAKGNGLVFNPGERVEGFSNFLWVMALALFNLIGFVPLVISKGLSFLILLILIFLTYRTARSYSLSQIPSIFCSLGVALSSGLAYYAMSGLETVFYAFLLLFAVYLNQKSESGSNQKYLYLLFGILAAAALTRPEGILFLLFTSAYQVIKKITAKTGPPIKTLITAQGPFYLIYGFFILFRYLYYSELLPNTYYAKPQGTFVEPGLSAFYTNLTKALLSGSFLLIPILFLLIKRRYLKKFSYPIFFCLIQLGFMSYTGDWMSFGRFFLPVLPLSLILFFAITDPSTNSQSSSPNRSTMLGISIAILILFAAANIFQAVRAQAHKQDYPYLVMNTSGLTQTGKWLNEKLPEDTRIATKRQGAVPFYSKKRSIDILGLTEKNIARIIYENRDIKQQSQMISEYVFSIEPDVIILFSSTIEEGGFVFDRSKPKEKMYYLEYLLYKEALEKGYFHYKELSLGRQEKAHILAAPDAHRSEIKGRSSLVVSSGIS
jgi:hypothetical protein